MEISLVVCDVTVAQLLICFRRSFVDDAQCSDFIVSAFFYGVFVGGVETRCVGYGYHDVLTAFHTKGITLCHYCTAVVFNVDDS